LALFTIQSQLNAGIIITIQPASASTTRVSFSDDGDTTVVFSLFRIDAEDFGNDNGWDFDGTNVYTGGDNNMDFTNTDSLPTFDVDGTTYTIHTVGTTYNHGDDSFGIAIEDSTPTESSFDFPVGSVFSNFTGTGIINESWDNFLEGSHSTSASTAGSGRLSVTLVVNPEPGSLLIGGITGVGMAFGVLRRRRQRQAKQQRDAPETAV
tara:strand:+ start:1052 stop:1675 length:624 start_codon:yes stop_codon:yes gene_type:complete